MSHVTNSVLAWGAGEDDEARLEEINAAIKRMDEGRGGFVDVSEKGHWYGGTKYLEVGLAIAAFNHFRPWMQWAAISDAHWEQRPARRQLDDLDL